MCITPAPQHHSILYALLLPPTPTLTMHYFLCHSNSHYANSIIIILSHSSTPPLLHLPLHTVCNEYLLCAMNIYCVQWISTVCNSSVFVFASASASAFAFVLLLLLLCWCWLAVMLLLLFCCCFFLLLLMLLVGWLLCIVLPLYSKPSSFLLQILSSNCSSCGRWVGGWFGTPPCSKKSYLHIRRSGRSLGAFVLLEYCWKLDGICFALFGTFHSWIHWMLDFSVNFWGGRFRLKPVFVDMKGNLFVIRLGHSCHGLGVGW